MVYRDFTEILDTAEEGGTVVSKVGGRFCVATGGETLGGRGVTKSKEGFHRSGGINDMVQRSVLLMAAGGNNSWGRMSGLVMKAMKAEMRIGFYHWRREYLIRILHILTSKQYSCRILASLRTNKYSSTRTNVYGYWKAARIQRYIRGFVVSQDKSMQPRTSIAC